MKKITQGVSLFLSALFLASVMTGCLFHKHTVVDDEPIPPTCTADGLTGASHCSECGEIISAGNVISALGHTPAEDAEVLPTCTETGKTAGSHCSVCGEILTAQNEVEKLPHTYTSKVEKAFTCKEDGVERFTCSVCEDSYTAALPRRSYTPTELFDLTSGSVVEITALKDGKPISLGSGFIISADGKIVTNYHVIDRASSVEVLIGEKKYTVKTVEAYDILIDIAVLKIDAAGLPYLPICKEDHKTGSTVYAVGNSQGFATTFTNGIITNAGRDVEGVLCIQHNAAISSGNSGGPLLNEYGEIIGVNAFTIMESQNLNFAISVKEINNLQNKTPMTVEAVRIAEGDAYMRVFKYVKKKGVKTTDSTGAEMYGVDYDEIERDNVVMTRSMLAKETEIDHVISWYVPNDDVSLVTKISLNKSNGDLYMYYTDSDNNEVNAVLKADATEDGMIILSTKLTTMKEAEAKTIYELFFSLHVIIAEADIQTTGTSLDDLMFLT